MALPSATWDVWLLSTRCTSSSISAIKSLRVVTSTVNCLASTWGAAFTQGAVTFWLAMVSGKSRLPDVAVKSRPAIAERVCVA